MTSYCLSTIGGHRLSLLLVIMTLITSLAWSTFHSQPKHSIGEGRKMTEANTIDSELLQQIQSTPLHMVNTTMFLSGPETYDLFVSLPQEPQERDIIKISSNVLYVDTSVYFLPSITDPCTITSYIDSSDAENVRISSFDPPIKPISMYPTQQSSLDVVLSQEAITRLLQSSPSADLMVTTTQQQTSLSSPLQQRFFYHIGLRCTLDLHSNVVTKEIPGEGDRPAFTHFQSTLLPSPKSFHIQIYRDQLAQPLVDEALQITPTAIVRPSIQMSLQSTTFDYVSQQYVHKISVKSSHICTVMVLFPVAPLDSPVTGGDYAFQPLGNQLTLGGELIKTPTTRSRSNHVFHFASVGAMGLSDAFATYTLYAEQGLLFQPPLDLSELSQFSHISLLSILKADTSLVYTITSPSRLIAPKGVILQLSTGHLTISIDSYYSVIDLTDAFYEQQQSALPSPPILPMESPLVVTPQSTTYLNLHFTAPTNHNPPTYQFTLDVYRLHHTGNLYCELSFHHLVHNPSTPLEFSVMNFEFDENMVDATHAAFVAGCLMSPQPSSGMSIDDPITTTVFKFYSKECSEYFYHTQQLKSDGGWAVPINVELRNEQHGGFLPVIPSLVCIPHDRWPNSSPHDDVNDNINNHSHLHLQTKISSLLLSRLIGQVPGAFLGTLHSHTRLQSYSPHFLSATEYLKTNALDLSQAIKQRPRRQENHMGTAEFLLKIDPQGLQYLAQNGSVELHIGLPSARLEAHTCTCGVYSTAISSLDDTRIYNQSLGEYPFADSQPCLLTPMTLQSGEQYSTVYDHHPELQFKLDILPEYISETTPGHIMVVCPIDEDTFVIPQDSALAYMKAMVYYRLTSPINNPTAFQVPISGMYITREPYSGLHPITTATPLLGNVHIQTFTFSHSIAYNDEFSATLKSCMTSLVDQFAGPAMPHLIPTIVRYLENSSAPFNVNPSEIWLDSGSYAPAPSPFLFEESISTQFMLVPSTTVWIVFFDQDFKESYSADMIFPHFKASPSFIPFQLQSCLTSTLQQQQPSPFTQSMNAVQQTQQVMDEDKSPFYNVFLRSLIGNTNHMDALRNGFLQPQQAPLTVTGWGFFSYVLSDTSTACLTQTGCNPACHRFCLTPREYRKPVQEMWTQEQQYLGATLDSAPAFHIDIDPHDYDTLINQFQLQTCRTASECPPEAYCGADNKCYMYPHIDNQFIPHIQPEVHDNVLHCVQRTPVSGAEGEYTYQRTSCELKADTQCPFCLVGTAAQCNVEVIVACYNQSFDMYVPHEYCAMPDTLPGFTGHVAASIPQSIVSTSTASSNTPVQQPISHSMTPTNTSTNTPGESLNDTDTILGVTFFQYADHDRVFTASVEGLPSCTCINFPYNGGEHCEIPMNLTDIRVTQSTGQVVHVNNGDDDENTASIAITHHYLAKDNTVDISWTFTGREDAPVQVYLMSTTTTTNSGTTPPQQQHALRYVGSTRGDKQSYTIVVPHLQRDVYTQGMTVVLFVGELSAVTDLPALPTAPTSFVYNGGNGGNADHSIRLFYQPHCFAWNDTTQISQSVCPGTSECSLALDQCVGCPAGLFGPLCDQFICETTQDQYAMSPQCVSGHYTACTVNGVVFRRPVEADAVTTLSMTPTPSQPTLLSSDTTVTPTQVAPNGSTCACTSEWSGAQCASPVACAGRSSSTGGGASLVCLNNGYRHYDPESDECDAQCTCTHHWSGTRCNTCGLTCTSVQRGYPTMDCRACQCTYGYTGAKCECRFLRGDITFGSYPVKYHRVFTGESHAAVDAYEQQYLYGRAAARGEQPPPAVKAEYRATLELIAGYNILMDSILRELTSNIDIPEARERVTFASVMLSPPRQNGGGSGGDTTPGNRSLIIVVQITDSCGKGPASGDDINSIVLAWDKLSQFLRDSSRPPIIIYDPEDGNHVDIGNIEDVTDLVDPTAETNGVVYGDSHAYSYIVLMSSIMYVMYIVVSMAIAILSP